MTDAGATAQVSESDVVQAFEAEMKRAGLTVSGGVISNTSGFVRFDGPTDKPNRRSAFYLLRSGKWPVGWYGDWKTGLEVAWSYHDRTKLSPADAAGLKKAQAKVKAELAIVKATKQEEAAIEAARRWEAAEGAPDVVSGIPMSR